MIAAACVSRVLRWSNSFKITKIVPQFDESQANTAE